MNKRLKNYDDYEADLVDDEESSDGDLLETAGDENLEDTEDNENALIEELEGTEEEVKDAGLE